MSFPPGRPIAVLALVAVLTGGWLLLRPTPRRADVTVWVFSAAHANRLTRPLPDGTPSLVEQYRRATGRTVAVQLVTARALDVRLVSALSSSRPAADIVEIEIGAIGKYFRGDAVGFWPLENRLGPAGVEQFLPSRLAPWTYRGHLNGLPDDVCPVSLTYRRDLFAAAGVDVEAATTWPQFRDACVAYQRYWHAHGRPGARAVLLHAASADELLMLLQQRHVELADESGQVRFDTPTAADTIAWYAGLIAGPDAIAVEPTPGPAGWAGDLMRGDGAVAFTPDWSIDVLRAAAPALAGKLAMRPLPKFEPTDAPTATWGGTMVGLPRAGAGAERHGRLSGHAAETGARFQARLEDHELPDATAGAADRIPESAASAAASSPRSGGASNGGPIIAWDAVRFLYLSDAAAHARAATSGTLPAEPARWADAAYGKPDPFFAGQQVGRLYADLARQAPPRTVTPYTAMAASAVAAVVREAMKSQPPSSASATARWLTQAGDEIRRRIAFDRGPAAIP